MKDTDLAWLAGIWDGEGTITISLQKNQARKNDNRLVSLITMTNTDIHIVNKAHKILTEMGVRCNITSGEKPNSSRPYYTVSTANQAYIKIFLEHINQYLVGEKKAKGELLLDFVTRRLEKRDHGLYTRAAGYDEADYTIAELIRSSSTTRETLTKFPKNSE